MKDTRHIVDAPIHNPDADYHFSEDSYFPAQFRIVGVALTIAGICLLLRMNLIGPLLLIIGLAVVLAKKTLTISFSLLRYRYAFTILNYRLGNWEPLPAFESISIFSARKTQEMAAGSQMGAASYSELEVNLVYNKNRRLTVYTTKDFNKALHIAEEFAEKFKLRIYDATQREGKWIS